MQCTYSVQEHTQCPSLARAPLATHGEPRGSHRRRRAVHVRAPVCTRTLQIRTYLLRTYAPCPCASMDACLPACLPGRGFVGRPDARGLSAARPLPSPPPAGCRACLCLCDAHPPAGVHAAAALPVRPTPGRRKRSCSSSCSSCPCPPAGEPQPTRQHLRQHLRQQLRRCPRHARSRWGRAESRAEQPARCSVCPEHGARSTEHNIGTHAG